MAGMRDVPHAGNGIDGGRGGTEGALVDNRIIDELQLRDGERIVVRPIRPDDDGQLAELHARLSPDSIYRRYFGFKPSLGEAELRRFTGIAEAWRFALVRVRSTGQLRRRPPERRSPGGAGPPESAGAGVCIPVRTT